MGDTEERLKQAAEEVSKRYAALDRQLLLTQIDERMKGAPEGKFLHEALSALRYGCENPHNNGKLCGVFDGEAGALTYLNRLSYIDATERINPEAAAAALPQYIQLQHMYQRKDPNAELPVVPAQDSPLSKEAQAMVLANAAKIQPAIIDAANGIVAGDAEAQKEALLANLREGAAKNTSLKLLWERLTTACEAAPSSGRVCGVFDSYEAAFTYANKMKTAEKQLDKRADPFHMQELQRMTWELKADNAQGAALIGQMEGDIKTTLGYQALNSKLAPVQARIAPLARAAAPAATHADPKMWEGEKEIRKLTPHSPTAMPNTTVGDMQAELMKRDGKPSPFNAVLDTIRKEEAKTPELPLPHADQLKADITGVSLKYKMGCAEGVLYAPRDQLQTLAEEAAKKLQTDLASWAKDSNLSSADRESIARIATSVNAALEAERKACGAQSQAPGAAAAADTQRKR